MTRKNYSQILKELDKQLKDQGENSFLHNFGESTRSKESTETQIRLDGLTDYYTMRRSWGDFLKICLGIILFFNISLVAFVGLGFLKYQDDWFLRIVLTTNLADIIGLVYLVVHFLFSNNSDATSNSGESK
jgi:hypothetical protein